MALTMWKFPVEHGSNEIHLKKFGYPLTGSFSFVGGEAVIYCQVNEALDEASDWHIRVACTGEPVSNTESHQGYLGTVVRPDGIVLHAWASRG